MQSRSPAIATLTIPAAERQNRIALLALFGGAIGIAFAPIFVRLSEVSPSATAFWRLFLAMPLLWVWMLAEQRGAEVRPVSRKGYLGLGLAGLFFAADLATWHWSIRFTSVANATLEANFAPVFVALGSYFVFGQRITRGFAMGMLLALAGLLLLLRSSAGLSARHLHGDLLGMITAVFYASYLLSVKTLRSRFSTATLLAWSGASASAALLVIALLFRETIVPHTLYGWTILLGLALLSHVGGQGLITYALAHLPATFTSVGLLVQPVAAALLAWVLLREPVNAWQAAGGALVLAGIYVARKESREENNA